MKIEETTKIDDNGSYSKITTTTQTPEDGLLTKSNHTTTSSNKIRTSSQSFYGYEKHIHYETSDPKIIKRVMYPVCTILIIIGILQLLLLKPWYIGLPWTIISIYAFFSFKKDMKKREKEFNKNQ